MASKFFELLPLTLIQSNKASRPDKIVDVGAYNIIQLQAVIPVAGDTNDVIILQHSAINDDASFFDIVDGDIALNATSTGTLITITNFLRYIRWKTGTITGTPKVLLLGIAKE